jgi:hypothetical protein
MMQEWLGDGTAGAAARILAALREGGARRIASELDRAAEICQAPRRDSCAAERTEVLDAVVRELRYAAGARGLGVPLEAHTSLLAHLAGL